MEASAASAELVRAELKSFRNRSVTISANEKCHTCSALLLSKPFFIFSCGHKFHSDCLEKQVKDLLGMCLLICIFFIIMLNSNICWHISEPSKAQRLASLKKDIAVAAAASPPDATSETNSTQGPLLHQLQSEYEMLLAAECLLCGHNMIECIDRPFIENWERVVSDWL